ncbi:bifunctional UDP-N-acetylglucosamine diphosphorylase/glucosamine-1-phosphate N-acetyltransferase GlmU [Natronoglycomyces albus]|uniref:Bifunctional protein GlmU n=1 Tax=Natronoglycomyces albus TaxID=2811108 RepID=A0A895XQZ8_9ACTN|nr:bifunctional UDP-N-acetylglucosamine diphosphorylase/glucosamine-1-phosphate N-acetyltransferase GlmU [Natronoglycomyces albus]QSB06142.1 bifunctional UDP-N-acetylglucosamine diphosphorylase/glucosamine-1-phosphate N-acetyltransferase GlmU [Natronoglycomyces albus]
MTTDRAVIVLAAGAGTRMKSAKPKMLHELLGRTLLGHVLKASTAVKPDHSIVVVGASAEDVTEHVSHISPQSTTVLQAEQNGTGHAVRTALEANPDLTGTVVVLNGDVPLLQGATVENFIDAHEAARHSATVMTAAVADPTGLGRIIRNGNGRFERIVEHRDATDDELAIDEINGGIYAFDVELLRRALDQLNADNDQGEEYLTDVLELLRKDGHRVGTHQVDDQIELLGCNDRAQLAQLRALLRDRINHALMKSGVTIEDPATTWIDATVKVENDVIIRPGCQLRGATAVDTGADIGPDSTLVDTIVESDAAVARTHAVQATIGPEATVGPYSYLRPGAKLGRGARVGAYVEVKASEIGDGAKVPHLSYVGDATVGERANVSCGVIVANYDGIAKHHTTIGAGAFVGCDSVLVAPVNIGDGTYVGAGSVVSNDVNPGELAVTRAQQRNIEGWVAKRRPGTFTAEAAQRAKDSD